MRKLLILLLVLIAVPTFIFFNGAKKMDEANDDDPMTESEPERIAHRDAVYAECLDGSEAEPDKLYCGRMADKTNAHYTDAGMIQEIFYHGTNGLVPRYYYDTPPAEEIGIRLEAERLAKRRGADGSTRFTGERVAEYEEEQDRLFEESDVFQSKAQRCDPDSETMKGIMKMRPGESVEQLHRGMDCEGWDK